MRLRAMAIMAGTLVASMIAGPITPASASVEYDFYSGPKDDMFSFHVLYDTDDYITKTTKLNYDQFKACGGFLIACNGVTFAPMTPAKLTKSGVAADELSISYESAAGGAGTLVFDFTPGSFASSGHHVAFDGVAMLDLSAVPLPAAAPMFGAALLVLAAAGHGSRHKKAAGTV